MQRLMVLVFICFFSEISFANTLPGVTGPFINVVNGSIIVGLGLPNLELGGGLELTIPRTINSSAALGPNNLDGGSLFTLTIDKADILKALNVSTGSGQTLPCGRDIPGIPGGILQNALRIDLPEDQYNLSFYFHKKLFGAYVPFNFDLPIAQSISIALKYKGSNIGSLLLVAKEGTKKAAGVIFLRIGDIKEKNELLKDLGF